MKALAEHVLILEKGSDIRGFEEDGYTIYTKPDGITYYAVDSDAPEEVHGIVSGAAQGDPEMVEEILSSILDDKS
jgi:hypothetical protein